MEEVEEVEQFVIELPLNYTTKPPPKLTEGEISLIWSLPRQMVDRIIFGIVHLDPLNPDDMLPAFFAYRQLHIPGNWNALGNIISI